MLHAAILHVYPLFLSLRMTYHKTGISIFSLQCALSYEHLSFFGHQIRFSRKLSSISSCVVYALLTRARLGIFAAKMFQCIVYTWKANQCWRGAPFDDVSRCISYSALPSCSWAHLYNQDIDNKCDHFGVIWTVLRRLGAELGQLLAMRFSGCICGKLIIKP